jgi:FdrA protein
VILFDLVLGDGAHPDPAAVLTPAVEAAQARALAEGRDLTLVVVLQGTAADPQDTTSQAARLGAAGAVVCRSVEAGVGEAWRALAAGAPAGELGAAVDAGALAAPLAAVNVGLEVFHDALRAQGVAVVQVDWRPPAGGDAELMALLQRMR